MTTPTSKSLQRAAQAWCAATTSHKEMDAALATEFARILDADLAARDAELAKMRDEREGNARQFRRLQDRLAQSEVDAKFWQEVSAEQRAELLKIAENPYEGNESALDYSCTHWKQRAEAAERELAAMKAENSKLRSALEIVHFKREPWQ